MEQSLNVSALFVIPMIGVINVTTSKEFINSYLTTSIKYDFETISLLFKVDDFNNFIDANKHLEENPNHVETFDLEDNKILYVFKIPDKFLEDLKLLKKGKYSQTSKSYQNLFPKYTYLKNKNGKYIKTENGDNKKILSSFYHIFNKTPELRKIWEEELGVNLEDLNLELYEIIDNKDEHLEFKELL